MNSEHKDIVTALVAVSRDVGAVRKDSYNQGQRFNFRGIDATTQAVYPAFIKHGILYTPYVVSAEYSEKQLRNGGAATSVKLAVDCIFYHTSGQTLTARVQAEAFDAGDKATAKAMSVAMRTALLQVLCLPTDEPDPDHDSYEQAPSRNTLPPAQPKGQGREVTWEQIAHCTNIDELRAMWRHASSQDMRESITHRVQQLQTTQTEAEE